MVNKVGSLDEPTFAKANETVLCEIGKYSSTRKEMKSAPIFHSIRRMESRQIGS